MAEYPDASMPATYTATNGRVRWTAANSCGFDMGEGDYCLLAPGHDGQHS
ncbi:hypothetical protein [Nocardioides bruguierae]|uniref:Uncharacterized protein n=1 Tax=Nocardioides bruguierae TaxID=2945102 RepID=A0A9X2DBT9_9ACTN|nr:hypothetical protein [Nocardioides bruguierae]MCM0622487.1 hypothetical protein [Nocardioides bruguierae]